MKHFDNFNEFALFSIKENLAIVKYCIVTPKVEGTNSCFGMSAIILLGSVIDSIGMFYRTGQYSPITEADIRQNRLGKASEHFERFYDKFLVGNCDKEVFTKTFYNFVRCRPIHNNVLGPHVFITKNKNTDLGTIIKKKRVNTHVFLMELYELVKDAYNTLKTDINSQLPQEQIQPTTGGTLN